MAHPRRDVQNNLLLGLIEYGFFLYLPPIAVHRSPVGARSGKTILLFAEFIFLLLYLNTALLD